MLQKGTGNTGKNKRGIGAGLFHSLSKTFVT